MTATLSAEIIHRSNETTLRLGGELDTSVACALQQCATEVAGAGNPVVVDCEGLERMDTAALQVLLALHAHMERRGLAVHWTRMRGAVREYLVLSGAVIQELP